jgi:hypothetical protein
MVDASEVLDAKADAPEPAAEGAKRQLRVPGDDKTSRALKKTNLPNISKPKLK